jgi:hypothetical protein
MYEQTYQNLWLETSKGATCSEARDHRRPHFEALSKTALAWHDY